jgi:hypothetical protein
MKLFKYNQFLGLNPINENVAKAKSYLKEFYLTEKAARELGFITEDMDYEKKEGERRVFLMKDFKIHYTENTYSELSEILKKMNWKVINSDETDFDGELTEGTFNSNEYNKILLLNTNGEIPVDIITKYEFKIRKNSLNTLLKFSYNIVEIKTNIDINNLNNNKDLIEIKELIDNKFYLKKEIISKRLIRNRLGKRDGRNPEIPFEKEYKSDSNYELLILIQLMKELDKRLELIEKKMDSFTSLFKNQDNIKLNDGRFTFNVFAGVGACSFKSAFYDFSDPNKPFTSIGYGNNPTVSGLSLPEKLVQPILISGFSIGFRMTEFMTIYFENSFSTTNSNKISGNLFRKNAIPPDGYTFHAITVYLNYYKSNRPSRIRCPKF